MGDLKARSFRVDDETIEKIKEISSDINAENQQEVLSKLIEAYEFQKGKVVLSTKASDIEEFERYTTLLVRKYMDSLQENQNITATVHSEFEAQLISKDKVIMENQEKISSLKEETEEAVKIANEIKEDMLKSTESYDKALQHNQEKLAQYSSTLYDKDNLINSLTAQINSLNAQLVSLQKSKDELLEKYNSFQDMISKEELARLLLEKESEIKLEMNKILFEAQKEAQLKLNQTIDIYQNKYFELLKQIETNHSQAAGADREPGQASAAGEN